ncbi:MAG TPA: nuclear transport factor 2 family protein [Solirubrobacteraceae bacterium]|jgi:ketosteroid isomerase-like protein|nr:nuclear transport factor 2 family protein [Solirubrobacteraceae bacterium]
MSQENVERLRRLMEAVNAGEVPEFVAADYRAENVNTAVTDKTYIGHDGVREWREDMFSAFGEVRLQLDKLIAESDDYVVAVTSLKGRGGASGAPLELRWANAFWFRNGRLVRSGGFLSIREALKAVGLEE